MRVGMRWRLLLCCDLRLRHHGSQQARESDVGRMFQTAFGVGRRFGKYRRGWSDIVVIVRSFLGDLLVDLLVLAARPSRTNFQLVLARIGGFFQGMASCSKGIEAAPLPRLTGTWLR